MQTITKPQYIVEVEDDEEAIQEINNRLGKPLGKAEIAIIRLLCEGLLDKEIAERAEKSVRTVTTQLASIYAKLGVNNRSALIAWAYQNKLA